MNTLVKRVINLLVVVATIISSASQASESLNGKIWVVNKRADNVSVIDVKTQTIVATLNTEAGPHELAIDANNRWAVVTNYVGGNSLSIFDIQAMKLNAVVDFSAYPKPHGVQFLPDSTRVVVSTEGADRVVIVDVERHSVTQAIDTEAAGSHMVALSSANQQVFTPNMKADSISVIDLDAAKLIRQIATPEVPEAINVNRAGTQLWVGSNKDGWLTVYDLNNDTVIAQWKDYSWPYRVAFSPDQTIVVVPDLRQHTLDFYDTARLTRTARIELEPGVSPKGVTFTPDGQYVLLSLYDKNQVAVIDARTGNTVMYLPTGDGPDGIGFVPEPTP